VLSPKSSNRGKLLSQYICVRIIRMDNVDIGLFEHDRHNTLYYYILNADEQIYMRYGGRDSESPDTYLNLQSLEIALEKGLELHGKRASLAKPSRLAPDFPKNYSLLVERTFARGQCVECHLIGDFQNLHRERDKTLDKLSHLFRSPDIKTIGIHLDIPKGLVLAKAEGAVAAAGIQPGDRILAVDGKPVYTFADLQHTYDKTDRRTAKRVVFTVDHPGGPAPNNPRDLTVTLPPRWWLYDVTYRQSSIDPRLYFGCQPLSVAEKEKYQLKPDGFACTVHRVDSFARSVKSHSLEVGDIVYSVNGVERDDFAHTAELYMKLYMTPGDSAALQVIRKGARLQTSLLSYRLSFRK
jgi:serine protease Do